MNTIFPAATAPLATTVPAIPAAQSHELVFPRLEDGQNFRVPQRTRLDRHQVRDAFSWILGKHSVQFGGEWQNFGSDIMFDLFGSGSIFLTQNFATQDLNRDGAVNDLDIPIAAVVANSAPPGVLPTAPDDRNSYFGYYLQDDWKMRSNLTLNAGLRWEFDTDIFGTDNNLHKPCPTPLSTAPTGPCIWLRTVLNLTHRAPDWNDWGPRLGFAWDPFNKGTTVIWVHRITASAVSAGRSVCGIYLCSGHRLDAPWRPDGHYRGLRCAHRC